MKKLIIAISLALLVAPAAAAVEEPKPQPVPDEPVTCTTEPTWHIPVQAFTVPTGPVVQVEAKKPSFAERHPRLRKHFRRIRRLCITLQPIVQFGGSVAQIITVIK